MQKTTIAVIAALIMHGGGARSLTLTEGALWPDFPVSVCFEDPRAGHKQDRNQIRKLVEQSWAKQSAVSFKGWGPCRENSEGIRILLSDGYPKTRSRGRLIDGIENGMQLPKLWGLASLSVNAKTTVHEFGHALGFGHEYARPDAPFDEACSINGTDDKRYVENDLALTGFDFSSIMVGCVKDATRAFSTGLPKLSAADIYGLVSVYGSAEHNILDQDEAGDLFGQSLAVGDFDGDDVPDLAVGAPGEMPPASGEVLGTPAEALGAPAETSGAVYLYRGDAILGLRPWGRLVAADHPDAEGKAVAGFGATLQTDFLNRDQRADLIVGSSDGLSLGFKGRVRKPLVFLDQDAAPAKVTKAIKAAMIEDRPDAVEAIQSVQPFDIDQNPEDIGFGTAAALIDLDLDGHLDLIVSAPLAGNDGEASGQVFVYRSPDTDFPWKQRPTSFVPWYRFGQAY